MLTAIPRRWFSWDFILMDGARTVGSIDTSSWRERGVLTVEGVEYRVSRVGLVSGDFLLTSGESVLARATKASLFRRAFAIQYGDRRYTLRARSAFRRAFDLLEGTRDIGSLSPLGIFTRRAEVDLPIDLPLPIRLFILWLAVVLWKREAES